MIAGIIFSHASRACRGTQSNRSPTPNRVGLFGVHSAVRTSLFGLLLQGGWVLVAELEAEYDSAPAAVGWDEGNALTNFAAASLSR